MGKIVASDGIESDVNVDSDCVVVEGNIASRWILVVSRRSGRSDSASKSSSGNVIVGCCGCG